MLYVFFRKKMLVLQKKSQFLSLVTWWVINSENTDIMNSLFFILLSLVTYHVENCSKSCNFFGQISVFRISLFRHCFFFFFLLCIGVEILVTLCLEVGTCVISLCYEPIWLASSNYPKFHFWYLIKTGFIIWS